MSYIIKNNAVIAKIDATLESGVSVAFASNTCKEEIDAARELNLVNAKSATISNAKKWEAAWAKSEDTRYGREINPGEFLVY